ncbi:four helix bundle protein [Pontibacter rugosus]|uniref:Four helix bundle protein n=1 Tax=Pontibacter rugosus TaxID=1745966 RepID=A0ABW3SQI5_9BACT
MKHNFRELKVCQEALVLAKEVYLVSARFPASEKFGLTSQVNRAVVSIPSNIAEGSGRSTNKDFSNFLSMALGSAYELETQLIIANELGFVQRESLTSLIEKLIRIQKMISNLQSRLKD